MKNRFYILSALILCLSIMLCACGKTGNIEETASVTEIGSTEETTVYSDPSTEYQTVTYTDVSGYHVVSRIEPSTQERTHPPMPTYKTETLYNPQNTEKNTAPNLPGKNEITTGAPVTSPLETSVNLSEPETIPEKSKGLSVQFKSGSVSRGDDATIAINASSGKEYTIEVYRNDKELLKSDKLLPKTAGANGTVSWTFPTDNLSSGYRKIIVRETGSDNFIQTSITVR